MITKELKESIDKKSENIREFTVWKAKKKDWIQTYTGLKLHVADPLPEEINIRDIAHQLSYWPRFAGTTPLFYSVAEHSLLVDKILVQLGIVDPMIRLQGLLHDSAEAYLGDIPSPIKVLLPEYIELEKKYLKVIGERFKVKLEPKPLIVEKADQIALAMEYRDLRPQLYDWALKEKALEFTKISPKSFILNEANFMKKFKELNAEISENRNGKS